MVAVVILAGLDIFGLYAEGVEAVVVGSNGGMTQQLSVK